MFRYFYSSLLVFLIGLVIAFYIGSRETGGLSAGFEAVFVCAVLAILEISLSFDNAIVNAVKLKEMSPLWRRRFMTWGMLVAVFGMRFLFPLLIVAIIAQLDIFSAFEMAIGDPQKYSSIMLSSHLTVSAFGGTFLLMVFLKYFVNISKEEHLFEWIEIPLMRLGHLEKVEITIGIAVLCWLSSYTPDLQKSSFLIAGMIGMMIFLIVEAIGSLLENWGVKKGDLRKADWGIFLYLEVLDASFSFDGVVGAFAISKNIFLILIGLTIGAMFVRSLTVFFVEKSILDGFKYLEHGAFYAVGILSISMLIGHLIEIPDWIVGVSGAFMIGISVLGSILSTQKS